MKVLIVEDEKALSDSIVTYLQKEGMICEVAREFDSASEKIHIYDYDVILVDIMLPDGSGLDIVKDLKKEKPLTGIIIISARDSLDDKINGLDLGADDYITKPFHLAELNSRIKSVIRRRKFGGNREIAFNEIRIDIDHRVVWVDGQIVRLTKKEYDLLIFLISNQNRVLTKESIAEHLWGDHYDTVDSFDFIFTHIKNLRKKIVESGGNDYIDTIYGVGYSFKP